MEIQLEQIWSSSYQPWQANEPWNTVYGLGTVTILQKTAIISYGYVISVATQTLNLVKKTPIISYGINIKPVVSVITINGLLPSHMGQLWDRIQKVGSTLWHRIDRNSTIWSKVYKNSTVWASVGTILWAFRNKPWLSTYYPWQEVGGELEDANYNKIDKPTTNYNKIDKTNL